LTQPAGRAVLPCQRGPLEVCVTRSPRLAASATHAAVIEVTRLDGGPGDAVAPQTSYRDADVCAFDLKPGVYRVTCRPAPLYTFSERDAKVVTVTEARQRVTVPIERDVRLFQVRLFRGHEPRSGAVEVEVYGIAGRKAAPMTVLRGLRLDARGGIVVRIALRDFDRAKAAALWFLDDAGKRTTEGLFIHLVDAFDPSTDEDAARLLWALGFTEYEPRPAPPTIPGEAQVTFAKLPLALALGWFQRRIGRDATLPGAVARERLAQYYRSWSAVAPSRWRLYAPRSPFTGTNTAQPPADLADPGWDTFQDYPPDPDFDAASLLGGDPPRVEREYVDALSGTLRTFHEDFMDESIRGEGLAALEPWARGERDAYVKALVEDGRLVDTAFDPKRALADEKPALRRRLFALLKNMTWPEVKAYFLAPDAGAAAGDRKRVLVAALNFRQTYFWKMLKALAAEPAVRGRDRALFAKSVGSNDLTSDIDVTMSGSMDVPAMQRIYELVKREWGTPSPALFDVMLYGRDWMMVFDNIIRDAETTDRWFQVKTFDPVMDLYGLAALVRFASEREWDAFSRAVCNHVDVPGLAVPPIFARLGVVRGIYDEQYVAPAARALGVAADKHGVEGMLHDPATSDRYLSVQNRLNVQLMAAARCDEDLVFRARPPRAERITWEQYDRATKIELPLDGGVGAAIAWIERQNQIIPQQALFAHEGYLTGGAMIDVVGTQGGKSPADMTVQHLLQSFNDQAGNAFKELHEYLHEHELALGAAPLEAPLGSAQPHLTKGAWRASKYELRMGMALQNMTKMLSRDPRVKRRRLFHERMHGSNPSVEDEDMAALRFECAVAERFDAHLNQLLLIRKAKEGQVSMDDMVFQLEHGRPPTEAEKAPAAAGGAAATPLDLADRIVERATRPGSEMMILLRDPSREQYTRLWAPIYPDRRYALSYRTLTHYLLTHAAIVNRGVRRMLARGPNDTYVRKLRD
jgi:hypothetical protein